MSEELINRLELKAARRRLARNLASVIIQAMADGDISFSQIAHRISKREKTVRRWLMDLADGKSKGIRLSDIADMFTAFAAEPVFTIRARATIAAKQDA